jgi:ribosomal protein S18
MKDITPVEYKIWLAKIQKRPFHYTKKALGQSFYRENPSVIYDKCHELDDIPFLLFRLSIADGRKDLPLSYKDPNVLKSVISALQRIASKHKILEGEIKSKIVAALI